MTVHDGQGPQGTRAASRRRLALPNGRLVLTIVLGIALVVMLIGHRQAILSGNLLAIALVAACLLLHPLLHRGHGHHRADERRDDQR